jgi:hypothetical protein
MGRHPVNDIHEHVALVYFATADTYNIAESINEHEQTETRWVGVDELSQMDLIPNVKFYATEALKELGK